MHVAPRRKDQPTEEALNRLIEAANDVAAAHNELRLAAIHANKHGGSIRVVAKIANKSTRTVQDWIKES